MRDVLFSHTAWIALGSNIQPEKYLPLAVRELAQLGEVVRVSTVWCSSPLGDIHQADFCNAALQLMTSDEPDVLKSRLRNIEAKLGRVRDPLNKNAARTIDLDIAFYDDQIINSPELIIPDPDIPFRAFLAVPLAELDPDFQHPVDGRSLRDIAAACGGVDELTVSEIQLMPK